MISKENKDLFHAAAESFLNPSNMGPDCVVRPSGKTNYTLTSLARQQTSLPPSETNERSLSGDRVYLPPKFLESPVDVSWLMKTMHHPTVFDYPTVLDATARIRAVKGPHHFVHTMRRFVDRWVNGPCVRIGELDMITAGQSLMHNLLMEYLGWYGRPSIADQYQPVMSTTLFECHWVKERKYHSSPLSLYGDMIIGKDLDCFHAQWSGSSIISITTASHNTEKVYRPSAMFDGRMKQKNPICKQNANIKRSF